MLLQVQSTCPEQFLREILFSCKKQVVLRRFSDFEGEIFEPLSKKFQKDCKKNPFMSQEEHCEWIFSRNILCPYFYSDIEQKILDFPRNVFRRVVATAVDASSGTFGGIVWFLKIRVFFRRFMKFEPKDCGNLSQIFNERLCELISKCVEEILEHFFRKKNNFSYIL